MSLQDELEPDNSFAEENKYFTLLANIVHENGGITQEMKDLLKEIREKEKLVKSVLSQSIESILFEISC